MSTLLTVGVAHHDAPLAQLERVAPAVASRAEVQARALAAGCAEVLVLSTCSRVELHAVLDVTGEETSARKAVWAVADRLVTLLAGHTAAPVARMTVAVGDDAVHHLFRVAAGLDSRIVGETEVQAQLRLAARAAAARRGEPHRLRRAVSAALGAAREGARTRRALLRRGLLAERSVARALLGHDTEPSARGPLRGLVVGAGTMGRQVAAALTAAGAETTLVSRSSTARSGSGPRVHPLEELPGRLAAADVVFVATSAGRAILSAGLVGEVCARRPGRPLTIVDLSLPRNVDPAVADVDGIRLLDLDDLADAGCGVAPDPREVGLAERAVAAAAEDYCAQVRSRRAGPTITALRTRVEQTCLEQLRRTTKGLDLPEDVLERMASAVAGAVAHAPTVLARQAAAQDDEEALALLRAAFRLDEADPAGSRRIA